MDKRESETSLAPDRADRVATANAVWPTRKSVIVAQSQQERLHSRPLVAELTSGRFGAAAETNRPTAHTDRRRAGSELWLLWHVIN
jgi:hypothetical protein